MAKKTFMELKKKMRVKKELIEMVQEQTKLKKAILNVFKEGPKTIPEVAEKLNLPSHEVMYWVMALHKYGFLKETGEVTEDGYYKYALVEEGDKKNGSES